MSQNQQPEIITLDCDSFGGHAAHWNILTNTPEPDVGKWLHSALDAAKSPMGLCQNEKDLPENVWLLQGPQQVIQVTQIIAVENDKPKFLKTAFPVLQSPYKLKAKITRILACQTKNEAVLCLELENGSVIYGYDTLFAVNSTQYQSNTWYTVEINAWAYELETVPSKETMLIDDPAAIRHHRALNDILADHNGETPDNLQELLAAWQPTSPEDELPVTIDISKMVAYLYGETMGQEDEAWFQGDIVGKTSSQFMDKNFIIYDVAIMREDKFLPIILRLAYPENHQQYEIGEFIRGNIWIQFKIYDTNTP